MSTKIYFMSELTLCTADNSCLGNLRYELTDSSSQFITCVFNCCIFIRHSNFCQFIVFSIKFYREFFQCANAEIFFLKNCVSGCPSFLFLEH